MTKTRVLVLDDVERWVGEFRLKLEEAGFDCLYSTTGEDALNKIRQDFHHTIKIVLTDELLKVDGLENGEKQRFQGRDVRAKIYRQRPDIQFVVISDLPFQEGRKYSDHEQGILAAFQMTTELSQGAGVIGVIDKCSLENSTTRQAKYQWLFSKIRDVVGEPKTLTKPGLFIGLGLPRAQYVQLASEIGVSEKSEIRVHEFLEKINPNRFSRKRDVEEFLCKRILGHTVKDFLQVLPTARKEKEAFLNRLIPRLDQVLIRKSGSSRLTRKFKEVGSSDFRILMILAWRAECGEEVVIHEADYVYQKRQIKASPDTGFSGLSEYSRQGAIDTPYRTIEALYEDEDDFDPFDAEVARNEGKVMDAIAYGWEDDSPIQIAEVRSTRSTNPLKTPVCRFKKYLSQEQIGTLQSKTTDLKASGERRLTTCYMPSFATGFYLYPIDER